MSVDENRIDNGEDEDIDKVTPDITNPKHGLHEYCLKNPWTDGLVKLKKDNYVGVTLKKNARKDRKRALAKFIRKVVMDAKTNNGSDIGREAVSTCAASWSDNVQSLDNKYYS